MVAEPVLEYLRGRTAETNIAIQGDIITTCSLKLDTGAMVEGSVSRDINAYDKEEASRAAYENAVEKLIPGIELMLNLKA